MFFCIYFVFFLNFYFFLTNPRLGSVPNLLIFGDFWPFFWLGQKKECQGLSWDAHGTPRCLPRGPKSIPRAPQESPRASREHEKSVDPKNHRKIPSAIPGAFLQIPRAGFVIFRCFCPNRTSPYQKNLKITNPARGICKKAPPERKPLDKTPRKLQT